MRETLRLPWLVTAWRELADEYAHVPGFADLVRRSVDAASTAAR